MLDPLRRATSYAVSSAATPARLASRLFPETSGSGDVGAPEVDLGAGSRDGALDPDLSALTQLLELVDDGTELLEDVVEEGVDLIEDTLGLHRRVWEDDGRDHAQIEVPAIADPAAVGLRQRLAQRLARIDNVRWAEVNAITSRVAIAFDGGESTLAGVIEVIESIEDSFGASRREYRAGWDTEERADHPADEEPIHRTVAIMAGDIASLGWTFIGQVAHAARLPVEAAGLVSIVDNNPWLRLQAQRLLGRRASALVLPLIGAAANGVAQGPFGTFVDLGLQAATLGELRARVEAWARREPEFYAVHSDDPIDPPSLPPRAEELASGPIESWSAWASGLGAGIAGITMAATRDPRLATDLVLASMPKAARLGREGFAAVLGRTLAKRGVVPLDGSALRRLDRIDAVVLDSEVLLADQPTVRQVVDARGKAVDDRTLAAAERLVLTGQLEEATRWRDWCLYPLEDVDPVVLRRARGAITRGREIRTRGGRALGLLRGGELAAIVEVATEIDTVVEPVITAIRAADLLLVIADADGRISHELQADRRVRTGHALGDDVRQLQAEGYGVMVIGRQGHRGLAAADVGVGIASPVGRPSWGADLILGRELADAATIVQATSRARDVSLRSARFAMGGSALAALVALTGTRTGAGRRALAVVNGAAGAALISGMWEAVQLSHEPRPRRPDRSRWHVLPAERVLTTLGTDEVLGLSSDEAARRRSARPAPTEELSPLEPFLAELANPLNPVLGIGAGLSAAAGSMTDASLVVGLIGVSTVVGGVQRLRADRTVRSLLGEHAEEVTAVRDGLTCTLREDELVPGDIIVLVAGDAVPADARVIAADGCEVDESSLTGESLPVGKLVDPAPEAELADRTCMLYEDTTVVAGSARAVVVATGHGTQSARSLALSGPPPRTGVELRLEELTRRLLPAALTVAAGTGGVGLLRRWPLREVANTAVSLAIASVPEGLPFVATAGQLAGARRLAMRGAIVRNPRTVEALGRVDVLCVDKTGTLTEGRVALIAVSDGRSTADLSDLDPSLRRVLAAGVLASDQPGDDSRSLQELDDADRALHLAVTRLGLAPASEIGGWALLDDLPFEASRGAHVVLGRQGRTRTLLAKGAPETLLNACDRWVTDGGTVHLDDTARAELHAHVDALAGHGHRLLAVAQRYTDGAHDAVSQEDLAGFELLGLLVLADPVRPTAAAAVRGIGEAGVRTIMVTGDHPETAASIGEELGLTNGHAALTGPEVDDLDDDQLAQRLAQVTVVARVSPSHKQRIVQVLQADGHVVAMTGDGANDAAAIRLAEVGVALGARSSAAAREAADIVLADDHIETLIDAIAEGRALWGSIREALAVLVGGNLGEIGFTALASAFSDAAPLHPRQFLLVNLLTDLAPAVAIAVRPPDDISPEVLLREGPDRSLGNSLRRDIGVRGTATAIGAMGAWSAARLTGTAGRARTVGLAALVGTQLGQTLVAGGWRRPSTLLTVGGSAVLFVSAVQTPLVSRVFGSRPIGPLGWGQAISASLLATAGSELASQALRRLDEIREGEGGDDQPAFPPTRRRVPAIELTDRPTRVLVTRAGGTVGRALVARLHADGHDVVAVVDRDPATGLSWGTTTSMVVAADDDHERLIGAAEGCAVIFHLGVEPAGGRLRDLAAREREAAGALARAADLAGTARIVHLGPLLDEQDRLRAPEPLYARVVAEDELRAWPVPVTDVRAGVVLGAPDRVYRLLRALARMPLGLNHPALRTRIQPVALGDLVAVLARLVDGRQPQHRLLEVGGPEVTTYEELVELIRRHEGRARLLRPPVRRVPVEVAAPALAAAAGLDPVVTLALLQNATVEHVVRTTSTPRSFRRLLRTTPDQALAELWEQPATS